MTNAVPEVGSVLACWRAGVILALAFSLAACGETWRAASGNLSGAYAERELGPELWRLAYRGDRYQTRETVQIFWLYRAAELALSRGYDGFSIQSSDALGTPPLVPVYIPFGITLPPPKHEVASEIRLLRAPLSPRPPEIFDAHRLRQELLPHVAGPRCTGENICGHRRSYLEAL